MPVTLGYPGVWVEEFLSGRGTAQRRTVTKQSPQEGVTPWPK